MKDIQLTVTPEMVRLIMHECRKKKSYATTSNAESFMKLFREEIEEALRNAIRDVVRSHYE
tara:strand:- start:172 stop:354 length:183 start_codon:yes stop_codon:yes gene_type:complete